MTCTLFAKTGKFTLLENLNEYCKSSGVKSGCHKAKYLKPVSTLQSLPKPNYTQKRFLENSQTFVKSANRVA